MPMALGSLGVVGCAEPEYEVTHPRAAQVFERSFAQASPEASVVASVDGIALGAEELESFWKLHPELDREAALRGLIEETLLAREAHRRGLTDTPDADFARKQGLVNAFLHQEVEVPVGDVEPDENFVGVLQRHANAPAGFRASHLVIVVPQSLEGEANLRAERRRELYEARYDEARPWIEASAERLGERPSLDALWEEAARLNAGELPEGFEAVVNPHLRFARVEEGDVSQRLPSGWIQVIPEFARAAGALVKDRGIGALSDPVRSAVGWHLIRVDEVMPEVPAQPDEVERFAAREITREHRAQAYREQLEALIEQAQIELRPELLRDEGVPQ
ncbi:hypothetical protein DL240_08635 [Lujinxingia litoralis]|uniref:PpiC domain-containing protein n=2 Tax=Lujinxingia litoralis TaxID=2211119 RepID=A0A328C7Z7_9DELT|nr:hypothetical protein DL240_08635 [Lujinxingia litoralis]